MHLNSGFTVIQESDIATLVEQQALRQAVGDNFFYGCPYKSA